MSILPLHPEFEPRYDDSLGDHVNPDSLVATPHQHSGGQFQHISSAASHRKAIGFGTRLAIPTLTAEVSSGTKSRRQPPPRTKWQRSTSSAYLPDCHTSSTPTQTYKFSLVSMRYDNLTGRPRMCSSATLCGAVAADVISLQSSLPPSTLEMLTAFQNQLLLLYIDCG